MYNEDGYAVVENALPQKDYESIKHNLVHLGWYFSAATATENVQETDTVHFGSFARTLYDSEPGKDVAPLGWELYPFVRCIEKYFDVRQIIRIRAGLLLPKETEIVHGAHVDIFGPHHTALFYFCTEEGAGQTYLYGPPYDPYTSTEQINPSNLQVIDKIEARENRALFFNGNVFHSSSTPKTIYKRIAVNINFLGTPHGNT